MSFTVVSSVSMFCAIHALTHNLLGYWRIVCTSRRVEPPRTQRERERSILASGSKHRAVWTTRLALSRLPTVKITNKELGSLFNQASNSPNVRIDVHVNNEVKTKTCRLPPRQLSFSKEIRRAALGGMYAIFC